MLTPLASAGTLDAPELTDAADDCQLPPGNHYADIVAAWISDETATSFNVNIALSKWTVAPLGAFTGYTLQFEHQGKQFGAAAFFDGQAWEYSNAYIDIESGESNEWADSTGSFTPGTPAILTVLFDKGHFPHADAADNALRGFVGGSADFKTLLPWFFAPIPVAPPADFVGCDSASSDATYTFQVGGHSAHASAPANATGDAPAPAANATGPAAEVQPAANAPAAGEADKTPGPALGLLLGLVSLAALALRRRRA